MKRGLGILCLILGLCVCLAFPLQAADKGEAIDESKLSRQTKRCLGCHDKESPGIAADWRDSLHARTSPAMALKKEKLTRRMSAESVKGEMAETLVGCYECHSQNTEKHKDSFNHFGLTINVVVSPQDCAVCHPVEVKEYVPSKKGFAVKNLDANPVYHTLVKTVTGLKEIKDGKIETADESASTRMDTCYGCHGTEIKVEGSKRVTSGPLNLSVPNLVNWPNQGVGRINPDGSQGACSSCHPRHSFSIDIARKPYTCAQCHLEPDVPGWNVYKESKHANIYSAKFTYWNFTNVPWVLGEDFKSPTCAACHNSLITTDNSKVIAERTHDFGARLWVRIFGLIYSHPQPKQGDTTIIKNKDGLPLPTDFTGGMAGGFLIDEKEQQARKGVMVTVCNGCHTTSWINSHFVKLDSTIKETDKMVLNATLLLTKAWENKLADNANPFDETIEHDWITQWLFYANSVRYASAMTGAPDYAAFKNGWWDLTRNLKAMEDWIAIHKK